MWCRNVRSQLSAYADGELTPTAARQVEEHLVGCAGCAREHAGLQRLVSLTCRIPLEELPASLHDRIITRLAYAGGPAAPARQSASRLMPPRHWAWAAFTTAAFAVACGVAQQQIGRSARELHSFPVIEAAPKSQPLSAPAVADSHTPGIMPAQPSIAAVNPAAPDDQPLSVVAPATPTLGTMPTELAVTGTVVDRREIGDRALSLPAKPMTDQPQPAVVATSGKPAMEARSTEPTSPTAPNLMMVKEPMMAMPGEPSVNSTGPLGQSDTMAMMEKEAPRMAGMAIEVETPGEEDEGLRTFRMFIQENSKMVPQPPAVTPGRKKSL